MYRINLFMLMSRGNSRQKMYWSQNIIHKVAAIKRLTGEEITHVESNWIPKHNDHRSWGLDQSPRHFRDV
jgi:hypothetical protein